MAKDYLLVFSEPWTHQKIVELVDKDRRVLDWFYSIPHSIFLRSEMSAKELSELLAGKLGQHRNFIVEIGPGAWGYLPKEHWPRLNRG
jgi:hypothetical protein